MRRPAAPSKAPKPPKPRRSSRRLALALLWVTPRDTCTWKSTLLVALLAIAPPLIALQLVPQADSLTDRADTIGFFLYPVLLASAVNLYFQWRLTDQVVAARLTTLLAAAAVQGLSTGALRIGYTDTLRDQVLGLVLVDVLFVVTVLAVVSYPADRAPRWDPAATGVVLGTVVTGLRVSLMTDRQVIVPGPVLLGALDLLLLALHAAVALMVLRMRPLPGWVRGRICVAIFLLGLSHALDFPPLASDWVAAIAILADLGGAALLCSTSFALLRRTARRRTIEVNHLLTRIHEVEHGVRGERERLHEIRATVAGLACASKLTHDRTVSLPEPRREQLDDMVASEIARLARLMDDRPQGVDNAELRETLEPLVVAQRALGRDVRWVPTLLRVPCRPDDLAEVVHILLENSATHAPDAAVTLSCRALDDRIEVVVEDDGPGIPPEIRPAIFEHGWHGSSSPGEGIGLAVAARLAHEMGGDLVLVENRPHTTFVLRLPLVRSGHDGHSVAAQ